MTRLVDSTVAAMHLRTAHGVAITPATIRKWGERGHITRHRSGGKHTRYDLAEIDRHARATGLVAS